LTHQFFRYSVQGHGHNMDGNLLYVIKMDIIGVQYGFLHVILSGLRIYNYLNVLLFMTLVSLSYFSIAVFREELDA